MSEDTLITAKRRKMNEEEEDEEGAILPPDSQSGPLEAFEEGAEPILEIRQVEEEVDVCGDGDDNDIPFTSSSSSYQQPPNHDDDDELIPDDESLRTPTKKRAPLPSHLLPGHEFADYTEGGQPERVNSTFPCHVIPETLGRMTRTPPDGEELLVYRNRNGRLRIFVANKKGRFSCYSVMSHRACTVCSRKMDDDEMHLNFPADLDRRRIWANLLGFKYKDILRSKTGPLAITISSGPICTEHFAEECFRNHNFNKAAIEAFGVPVAIGPDVKTTPSKKSGSRVPWVCTICDFHSCSVVELQTHLLEHTEEMLKQKDSAVEFQVPEAGFMCPFCRKCTYGYKTISGYRRHLASGPIHHCHLRRIYEFAKMNCRATELDPMDSWDNWTRRNVYVAYHGCEPPANEIVLTPSPTKKNQNPEERTKMVHDAEKRKKAVRALSFVGKEGGTSVNDHNVMQRQVYLQIRREMVHAKKAPGAPGAPGASGDVGNAPGAAEHFVGPQDGVEDEIEPTEPTEQERREPDEQQLVPMEEEQGDEEPAQKKKQQEVDEMADDDEPTTKPTTSSSSSSVETSQQKPKMKKKKKKPSSSTTTVTSSTSASSESVTLSSAKKTKSTTSSAPPTPAKKRKVSPATEEPPAPRAPELNAEEAEAARIRKAELDERFAEMVQKRAQQVKRLINAKKFKQAEKSPQKPRKAFQYTLRQGITLSSTRDSSPEPATTSSSMKVPKREPSPEDSNAPSTSSSSKKTTTTPSAVPTARVTRSQKSGGASSTPKSSTTSSSSSATKQKKKAPEVKSSSSTTKVPEDVKPKKKAPESSTTTTAPTTMTMSPEERPLKSMLARSLTAGVRPSMAPYRFDSFTTTSSDIPTSSDAPNAPNAPKTSRISTGAGTSKSISSGAILQTNRAGSASPGGLFSQRVMGAVQQQQQQQQDKSGPPAKRPAVLARRPIILSPRKRGGAGGAPAPAPGSTIAHHESSPSLISTPMGISSMTSSSGLHHHHHNHHQLHHHDGEMLISGKDLEVEMIEEVVDSVAAGHLTTAEDVLIPIKSTSSTSSSSTTTSSTLAMPAGALGAAISATPAVGASIPVTYGSLTLAEALDLERDAGVGAVKDQEFEDISKKMGDGALYCRAMEDVIKNRTVTKMRADMRLSRHCIRQIEAARARARLFGEGTEDYQIYYSTDGAEVLSKNDPKWREIQQQQQHNNQPGPSSDQA